MAWQLSDDYKRKIDDLYRWYIRSPRNGRPPRMERGQVLPVPLMPFELYEDLTPGGTAQAYPRSVVDGEYETDTSADTFEVQDARISNRGRGRNDDRDGSYGYYRLNTQRRVKEIVWLQPMVTHFRASVSGALLSTDATIDLYGVSIMQPPNGIWITDDGDPPDDVDNSYNWDADSDALVYCLWDESAVAYVPYQVECPA